jgi:hypothetical protein
MQRLLLLTIVVSLATGYSGCARRRGAPCTPCVPAPACTPGVETYGTPTVITTVPSTVPSLTPQTIPGQLNPGPETYTPSMP